ncbi:regulator of microtubule dynamics protein 1-like [Homalodisca vitripennis]|uniref:regulator of microtubule dynamics protein 1-like n=1 Tax=Homalodisca vitripennis TaxID=197043 RepID=UPI001EEA5483|nr:regulator of microtubule dynamics protein 1-like [Homalodisca vitripennis]
MVAVGVGAMVGAAGFYLYRQLFGDSGRTFLQQDTGVQNASNRQSRRSNPHCSQVALSVTTEAETDKVDNVLEFSPENETSEEETSDAVTLEYIDLLIYDVTSHEDSTKAYGLLLELVKKFGDDDDILWRLAKTCYGLAIQYERMSNKEEYKEMIYKGVEYGQKAIDINEWNGNAHKWFAVCVGIRGQLQGVTGKLMDSQLFKIHLDKALTINPTDPTLHHLRGRYHLEMYKLSSVEQMIATTLFGAPPEVSLRTALSSLFEAEKHNKKGWKANTLLIAKCYLEIPNLQKGLDWLKIAKKMPVHSSQDAEADEDIDIVLGLFFLN